MCPLITKLFEDIRSKIDWELITIEVKIKKWRSLSIWSAFQMEKFREQIDDSPERKIG